MKTMMIEKLKTAAKAAAIGAALLGLVGLGAGKLQRQLKQQPAAPEKAAAPAESAADHPDFHWRAVGPGVAQIYGFNTSAVHPTNPDIIVTGGDIGTFVRTSDGGKTWKVIGQSGRLPPTQMSGAILRVVFDFKHPDIVWMGTGAGLFKSLDAGETWSLNFRGSEAVLGAPMQAIAVDPTDDNIVYTANGHWLQFAGATYGNVYKTTDGGKSWNTLPRPGEALPDGKLPADLWRNYYNLAIDPSSPFVPGQGHQRLYLVGAGGLFVSENGGQSWASLEDNLPGGKFEFPRAKRRDGALSPARFCAVCDVSMTPVEGKKDWDLLITLYPHQTGNADEILGGVYRSKDRGKTWAALNSGIHFQKAKYDRPQQILFVHPIVDPSRWYVTTVYYRKDYGTCYRTDNAGRSWAPLLSENCFSQIKGTDFDGKKDELWIQTKSSPSGYNCQGEGSVSPSDSNRVFLAGDLTLDGGKTWQNTCADYGDKFCQSPFPELKQDFPTIWTHKSRGHGYSLTGWGQGSDNHVAVDPFDSKTIAYTLADAGLRISRDGGEWWEYAYHGILGQGKHATGPVLYDPRIKGRMFVAPSGAHTDGTRVYQSDDGGQTFRAIGIPQLAEARRKKAEAQGVRLPDPQENRGPSERIRCLALDAARRVQEVTLHAATSIGIFKTDDGGANWADISGPLAGKEVHGIIYASQVKRLYAWRHKQAYAEEAGGLFRSDDQGKTWRHVGDKQIGNIMSMSLCQSKPDVMVAVAAAAGDNPSNNRAVRDRVYWKSWRSDDAGDTWRLIDERSAGAIAVHPLNPDLVCIGLSGIMERIESDVCGLFVSRDGGKTWLDANKGAAFSFGGDGYIPRVVGATSCLAFDPQDPQRILVGGCNCLYVGRCPFPVK